MCARAAQGGSGGLPARLHAAPRAHGLRGPTRPRQRGAAHALAAHAPTRLAAHAPTPKGRGPCAHAQPFVRER